MSVPVMSLGIRSGVNWMRENLRSSTCAIVWMSSVFAKSRHADDQAVAAGEQRQQHELDDVFLPDDELVQLGDDLIVSGLEPVGERDVVGRFERGTEIVVAKRELAGMVQVVVWLRRSLLSCDAAWTAIQSSAPSVTVSVRQRVNDVVDAELVRLVRRGDRDEARWPTTATTRRCRCRRSR